MGSSRSVVDQRYDSPVTNRLGNCNPALRRAWHSLCRDTEIGDQPRAFRLLGEDWVVWRDGEGVARVFRDVCPHRLAPLSLGTCTDGAIRCPYHGWTFDGEGACVDIPALGPDATYPPRAKLNAPAGVYESHGIIFIAPEEPLTPKPVVAAASDPAMMRGDIPVETTRGGAGLLADNFLDMAHFPFVHVGTFGAGEATEVPPYTVTRDGYRFEAVYEHDFANREDPKVATGEHPLIQRRRLTYRYTAPFHLELDIHFLETGGTNVIGFFLTPVDDEHVRVYSSLWRNDMNGDESLMQAAVDFEVAVIAEDVALQSRFGQLTLPLDPTIEVHTRADKTTIELRRILADLCAAASA